MPVSIFTADLKSIVRFAERVAVPASSNIFANKDAEMLTRAMSIRKLSLALYAAKRNHFLTQLPTIQEKLVELLRSSGTSPMIQNEASQRFYYLVQSIN